MLSTFWVGGGDIPQQMVQKTVPSAGEATQLIDTFKSVAAALHMDVWWLTLVVFSFVWGLRGFLRFVKVDMKKAPKFRVCGIIVELEAGWWPALRNWSWRGIAVVFSCSVCALAQRVAPESLPEVHWIVLGPTYGIGAVILYHILDYMGIMTKLGGKKK